MRGGGGSLCMADTENHTIRAIAAAGPRGDDPLSDPLVCGPARPLECSRAGRAGIYRRFGSNQVWVVK